MVWYGMWHTITNLPEVFKITPDALKKENLEDF